MRELPYPQYMMNHEGVEAYLMPDGKMAFYWGKDLITMNDLLWQGFFLAKWKMRTKEWKSIKQT
jgi:hypothetical protein